MNGPRLGEFVSFAADPWLGELGCEWLEELPAIRFAEVPALLFKHLAQRLGTERYIHPTARISEHANIGERVVIGPGASVYEYTTVRENAVVSQSVHLGYGCEVSRSVILAGAAVCHRALLVHSIVGREAWLADGVRAAAVGVWNPDPLNPSVPVRITLLDGTVHTTASAKAAAVFGDRVRCAADVSAGPGSLIGRDTVIYPSVRVHGEQIPAGVTIRRAQVSLDIRARTDLSVSA